MSNKKLLITIVVVLLVLTARLLQVAMAEQQWREFYVSVFVVFTAGISCFFLLKVPK